MITLELSPYESFHLIFLNFNDTISTKYLRLASQIFNQSLIVLSSYLVIFDILLLYSLVFVPSPHCQFDIVSYQIDFSFYYGSMINHVTQYVSSKQDQAYARICGRNQDPKHDPLISRYWPIRWIPLSVSKNKLQQSRCPMSNWEHRGSEMMNKHAL
jgi:hypothetical protein